MFQAKDGLKFSFGFRSRQETSSAFSTPKFPSIQINKDSSYHPFYPRHKIKASTQQIQINKHPSELYKELGGGGVELIPRDKKLNLRLNDKYVPFISGDANSLDKYEAKSVKSAHLSNEKDLYQSQKKKYYKVHRNKNFHSLANILQLRAESELGKASARIVKNKLNIRSQTQSQSKAKTVRANIKDILIKSERKATKKVTNNFFQISPKNLEMRQTKKDNRSAQKQQTGQKEKSRVFKSYFHKARPTLRIGGRQLNNQRLNTIVKDCEQESIIF